MAARRRSAKNVAHFWREGDLAAMAGALERLEGDSRGAERGRRDVAEHAAVADLLNHINSQCVWCWSLWRVSCRVVSLRFVDDDVGVGLCC
jgi:hypothetical protein